MLKDINLQNKTNTAIKSLYKSLKAPHNDPLKTHHEEMYLKKKKAAKTENKKILKNMVIMNNK